MRGVIRHPVGAEFEETDIVLEAERNIQTADPRHRVIGFVLVTVKHQPCASRKSPRLMRTGSPLTTVQTRSPSTEKRKEFREWRCSRAASRGSETLDRAPECRRNVWGSAQPRIGQSDGQPLATPANRHEIAGCFGQRVEIGLFSDMGNRLRSRMHRHEIADLRLGSSLRERA